MTALKLSFFSKWRIKPQPEVQVQVDFVEALAAVAAEEEGVGEEVVGAADVVVEEEMTRNGFLSPN